MFPSIKSKEKKSAGSSTSKVEIQKTILFFYYFCRQLKKESEQIKIKLWLAREKNYLFWRISPSPM